MIKFAEIISMVNEGPPNPNRMKNYIDNFVVDTKNKSVAWKENSNIFITKKQYRPFLRALNGIIHGKLKFITAGVHKLEKYDKKDKTVVMNGMTIPIIVLEQMLQIMRGLIG